MIIIGHRGAAGLAPENTTQAMRAGLKAGADMLEFDVRLTRDGVPVVIHDASTRRTHDKSISVGQVTLSELQDKTLGQPIPTLAIVLDEFFGKIKLNIECKGKGSGVVCVELVSHYVKHNSDWDNVLFSSFHIAELAAVRSFSEHARLAILHRANPFLFIAHHKKLRLAAAGFYKLAVNPLAIAVAKKRGLFTYAYTVNQSSAARLLEREGIEGIVTNYPDRF